MTRKQLSALASIALLLCLSGCGGDGDEPEAAADSPAASGATGAGDAPPPPEPKVRYSTHRCLAEDGAEVKPTTQRIEAFRLLVPSGWELEGQPSKPFQGESAPTCFGVDLMAPARVAFTLASPEGKGALQVYTQEHFVQATKSLAHDWGLARTGDRFRGAVVREPKEPAAFIHDLVIPQHRLVLRENKTRKPIDQRPLPELAKLFEREAEVFDGATCPSVGGALTFKATAVTISYDLNGTAFRERFVAVLFYRGQLGLQVWGSRLCASIRAPASALDRCAPDAMAALCSLEVNTRWLVESASRIRRVPQPDGELDDLVRRTAGPLAALRRQIAAQLLKDLFPNLPRLAPKDAPDGRVYFLPADQQHHMNDAGEIISDPPPSAPDHWHPMPVSADY